MDQKVKHAIEAALVSFEGAKGQERAASFVQAFSGTAGFLEKLDAMDALFDEQPHLEPLREVFFDLLLMNFFASDAQRLEADYLESPQWMEIEEQTIDRGTELLNVLLYVRECADEELDPTLEDYLKEFLLVDEDEFQDEHRIYEYVIANQVLADSSYQEIAVAAERIADGHELQDIFYPMVSFFYEPGPSPEDMEEYAAHSADPATDKAIYTLIVNYFQ